MIQSSHPFQTGKKKRIKFRYDSNKKKETEKMSLINFNMIQIAIQSSNPFQTEKNENQIQV